MKFKIAYIAAPIAVSAVIAVAGDANASFQRVHASGCVPITQHGQTATPQVQDNDFSIGNTTNNSWELMCPAPDSDTINKFQWTTVNVELFDYTFATTDAAICQDFWNGNGGGCSPTRRAGSGGHQTLALGPDVPSIWTSASESNFGYVYVLLNTNLPPNGPGGDADLRGIFFAK